MRQRISPRLVGLLVVLAFVCALGLAPGVLRPMLIRHVGLAFVLGLLSIATGYYWLLWLAANENDGRRAYLAMQFFAPWGWSGFVKRRWPRTQTPWRMYSGGMLTTFAAVVVYLLLTYGPLVDQGPSKRGGARAPRSSAPPLARAAPTGQTRVASHPSNQNATAPIPRPPRAGPYHVVYIAKFAGEGDAALAAESAVESVQNIIVNSVLFDVTNQRLTINMTCEPFVNLPRLDQALQNAGFEASLTRFGKGWTPAE